MTQAEAVSESILRISRTLAAPRELVFKAWTEPDNLKKMVGPGRRFLYSHRRSGPQGRRQVSVGHAGPR